MRRCRSHVWDSLQVSDSCEWTYLLPTEYFTLSQLFEDKPKTLFEIISSCKLFSRCSPLWFIAEFNDKKSIKTSPHTAPLIELKFMKLFKMSKEFVYKSSFRSKDLWKIFCLPIFSILKFPPALHRISVRKVFNTVHILHFCEHTAVPLTQLFNWNFPVTFTKDRSCIHIASTILFLFRCPMFCQFIAKTDWRQDMPSVKWKSLLERRALKKSHNKYY